MASVRRATHELQVGDVVLEHGVRFRLTKRFDGPVGIHMTKDPTDVYFHTQYDGTYWGHLTSEKDVIAEHGGFGRDMVNNKWTIQGNGAAYWDVEA